MIEEKDIECKGSMGETEMFRACVGIVVDFNLQHKVHAEEYESMS
jgi:hypothetical protein